MKNNMVRVVSLLLCLLFLFTGCSTAIDEPVTTTQVESTAEAKEDVTEYNPEEPVVVPEEVIEEAQGTKSDVNKGEDIATDEVVSEKQNESKVENEDAIINEDSVEQDAIVEYENISYDGTNTGKGTKLLGKCTGLTYYSQIDSRWKKNLYTSCNNKSQTIGSSGCGPTSASIIVSSSKGVILPSTMANLFVANGYRTKNNGTAWSAWSFVADYFDFDFYTSTSKFSTVEKYLETDKNKDGVSDYFVVVSCAPGLFTSGGHYITIMGDKNNKLMIYDPYYYYGKFSTASRKGANVKVKGSVAYVTEANFKKYANYKHFWIFSNDRKITKKKGTTKIKEDKIVTVEKTRYVNTKKSNLNVRSSNNTNSSIITHLPKGTKVVVTKESGNWSYIKSPVKGWVSNNYLSSSKPKETKVSAPKYKTVVGKKYKLKYNTYLYSKSDLTGTKYSYLKLTEVEVLTNTSTKVVKVKAIKTGRVAYISVDALVL